MEFMSLVNENYSKLNDMEKKAVSYILKNRHQILTDSITVLAEKTHVSKSALHRLTQKLGFCGYTEFKYLLKKESGSHGHKTLNYRESQFYDIETTFKVNRDKDFEAVCRQINAASHVYAFGTGFGQLNCLNEFSRNLMFTGINISIIPAMTELEIKTMHMKPEDLLIIVSLSGNTRGIEQPLQQLLIRETPIISLTESTNNLLASLASYQLYYKTTPFKLDGFNRELISFVPCAMVLDHVFRTYIDLYLD